MTSLKDCLAVITAAIETSIFGGLIYGWGSLSFIFVKEGYYNSSCNATEQYLANETAKHELCSSQQYHMDLIFTAAGTISLVFTLLTGWILDRFGTWVVAALSNLLYAGSCLAIAFSTYKTSWVLYPGMMLISVFGISIFLFNTQTANLFPNARSAVVNLLSGCLAVSVATAAIMKMAFENGIGLRGLFVSLAIFRLLMLPKIFLLLPRMHIPYNVPRHFKYGISEINSGPKKIEEQVLIRSKTESFERPLQSYVCTFLFCLNVFNFTIQGFRADFLCGTLGPWLTATFSSKYGSNRISSYINAYSFIHISALVCAPLNGFIMDTLLAYYQKKANLSVQQSNLRALTVVTFIVSFLNLTYSICVLFPNLSLQYLSALLLMISNVNLVSNSSMLYVLCFPTVHYGKLSGLTLAMGKVFGLLQFLLFYIVFHVYDGDFFVINLIFVVLVFCTFSYSIYLGVQSLYK